VISPIAIDVTVPWSVYLSCSSIVLKQQKIRSISFVYDSPMSFQDRIKIWLTSLHGSTLPPQTLSQSDLPLLTWASQTFDGKLQPNQSSRRWVSGSWVNKCEWVTWVTGQCRKHRIRWGI